MKYHSEWKNTYMKAPLPPKIILLVKNKQITE